MNKSHNGQKCILSNLQSYDSFLVLHEPVLVQGVQVPDVGLADEVLLPAAPPPHPPQRHLGVGAEVDDEVGAQVNVGTLQHEVEPAGQHLVLGLRHPARPPQVLREAELGGVEGALHHLDGAVAVLGVVLEHGQLDVRLKGQAPPGSWVIILSGSETYKQKFLKHHKVSSVC